MTDPITEADLLAYVDDQLDPRDASRSRIIWPTIQQRLRGSWPISRIAMLSGCSLRPPAAPAGAMLGAAGRLERALVWRDLGMSSAGSPPSCPSIGFGWFAHAQIGLGITDSEASPKPPAFVEDALHSHETALLRARMVSQPEAADYDPAEILAETGIQLPSLPDEWRVLDAQVFPSRRWPQRRDRHRCRRSRPGVALRRTGPGFDVIAPTLARFDEARAVYWQTGQLAYALTGTGSDKAIERAAIRLSRKLQ